MMEKLIIEKTHPYFTTGSSVKEICKPLFRAFNISYFLYTKLFRDGKCIWLCSNSDWLSHYCDMHYYDFSTFEQSIEQYRSGIYLWTGINSPVLQDARNFFNIDNGVTLIENSKVYCDFYHFATSRENNAIINFYINNEDVLRKFILYFKEQSQTLIDSLADETLIQLPAKKKIKLANPHKENIYDEEKNKNLFFEQIQCNKFYLPSIYNYAILSKREVECLEWLVKGKTFEEISILLNISKRTVINHIENIKHKTGCFNRIQLFEIANVLGLKNSR